MTKKINKYSFFDRPFFSFSFRLVSRKVSVYLTAILYFIMVLCYTTIVPIISESEPIEMFSSPVSGMFLMFCISMVGSFLAIEIFRSSIEDGTELLTVSKPISRKEVVMVKLTIFLLFIIIISTFSLGFSSFMFLNPLGNKEDNIKILIGIFVATLINGIIFGSIATFLSLFCKKIIALLTTLSLTFILMVYSMLSSFVVKSPITKMQQEGYGLKTTSLVNYDDKNKNRLSLTQGATVIANDMTESPFSLWKKYSSDKSYLLSTYFDFGYQLSSLYTLSEPNPDIRKSIQTMSFFNTPIDFKFESFDLNTLKNITIPIPATTSGTSNNVNLVMFKNDSAKIEDKSGNKYGLYSITEKMSLNEINNLTIDNNGALWNEAWVQKNNNKTVGDYVKEKTNGNYFVDHAEYFLEKYLDLNNYSYKNKKEIIKKLDNILLSGFNKFLNMKKDNSSTSNDEDIKKQFTTLVNLMGVKFVNNPMRYLNFNSSTTFKFRDDNNTLTYRPSFSLTSTQLLKSGKYQKITSISSMNRDVLIGVWSSISVVIFILTMVLYSRRDFA